MRRWDRVGATIKKVNEDVLAGKLRYASRASAGPGVPEFLTYARRLQPIRLLQTAKEFVFNSFDRPIAEKPDF
jgi:hypothetical protein